MSPSHDSWAACILLTIQVASEQLPSTAQFVTDDDSSNSVLKIGSINICQSNSFGTESLMPERCCCGAAGATTLGKQGLN